MTRARPTYRLLSTPFGTMGLVARGNRLAGALLPDRSRRRLLNELALRWPGAVEQPKLFPALARQVNDYFAGRSVRFRVALDLSDRTELQRSVLTACRRIRPGTMITYGDLARRAGRPRAARAVGRAMATNPIPLIIPCHRVIGADGRLGGFSASGGTKLKAHLQEHEQRFFGRRVSHG